MTWSIQLTIWALPTLLALLLVTRDVAFLWPRWREGGIPALLGLVAAVGVWASLDLLAVVSPALDIKLLSTRLEYVPASLAPVAWAWFALTHAGRKSELTRWPMLLLFAAAATTTGMALDAGAALFLLGDAQLVTVGGTQQLDVQHGPGHVLAQVARIAAVLAATSVVSASLAAGPRARSRMAFAAGAGLVAVLPGVIQWVFLPGAAWADLSSAGFAIGAALMTWGLARPHVLHLGPVDRDMVLRELKDPIVVMDGRGRIVDLNRAATDELGLVAYGDVPVSLGTLWATGPAPEGTPPTRIALGPADEEGRIYEVTLTPLETNRRSGRSALLLRDVTSREQIRRALERANADLERLAKTDPLTGLANRRHFIEVLNREIERSQRYQRPLSLVLLDLDHFKKVNDTHGHSAGDDVLRGAAESLRSVCRDVDLAARLGGEELALLLPETDMSGARVVAERLRDRIQKTPYHAPSGAPFGVTASLGVATTRGGSQTGDELLQASDEALYRAKDNGRNRVELAGRAD